MGPMDAVNAVKELADLVKKANDVPLYERIVTLQGQVVDLATERLQLYQENQELKKQLDLRARTTFKNPYYYQDGDEVPLCRQCYESSNGEIRIHLPHPPEPWDGHHRRVCTNCKNPFFDEGHEPGSRSLNQRSTDYDPYTGI